MSLRLTFNEIVVPLTTPLKSGWGTIDRRTLFMVEVAADDDGLPGRGEAAPLEAYDGVSDDACRAALQHFARVLPDLDPTLPGHEVLTHLQAGRDVAHALSAVDLALWDRAGRAAGKPVAQLIDVNAAGGVDVQALIGSGTPQSVREQALGYMRDGFRAFKLKVAADEDAGSPDALARDAARVAALRDAAGADARIKLDANGRWSVEQAVDALRLLTRPPYCVAAVEEPVSGGEHWPHLRAAVNALGAEVDLSIDETADREPGAFRRGADTVELKLGRTGGIGPLLVQAAVVSLAGVKPGIASAFDGPLGIAAAVHVGAALRLEHPLGLATLAAMDFSADPLLGELAQGLYPVGGRIAVPAGPGLI